MLFALLASLALAADPVAGDPNTNPRPSIEAFTLGDVQLATTADFGRMKLTTFSNVGSSTRFGDHGQHWIAANIFTQAGIDVAWNSEFEPGTNGWTILRGGLHWSFSSDDFSLKQSLNAGVIVLMPNGIVKPQLGYSAFLTALGGRLNVLTIHALSFDTTDATAVPGYYYEGYIDGSPWPGSKRGPRIGMFYENTYGPRVGPRFAIGGFYTHVNVLGEFILYAGYQFVL